MNRNKAGIVCMAAGAVLIVSTLLLFLYNWQEDNRAGRTAVAILPEIQAAVSENSKTPPEHTKPFGEGAHEMTVVEIDGYGYIGCLSIPVLELELPVMAEWSYPRLKIAPCRQFGSTKEDSLVIAGHNYRKHFGKLAHLAAGDLVLFTDMDSEVSYYLVGSVSVIPPKSTEEVKNSEWDLVLYTCTYSGQRRVMVGCSRTTEEALKALVSSSWKEAEGKR